MPLDNSDFNMKRNYEFDKIIGEQIKMLRIAQNLTQDALSAQLTTHGCNISQKALEKIENGRRHIYTDEIFWFHILLHADYTDFLPNNVRDVPKFILEE